MIEKLTRNRFNDTDISRRTILRAALVGAASNLLAADQHPRDALSLLGTREVLKPVLTPRGPIETFPDTEGFSVLHVKELVGELQEHSGANTKDRIESVMQSRRLVLVFEDDKEEYMYAGTAFQIDKSGIYITAGHIADEIYSLKVGKNISVALANPNTGSMTRSVHSATSSEADIAVLYAPSGERREPIEGLQFNFSTRNDEGLWMVGYHPRESVSREVLKYGTVTPLREDPVNLIGVKGMRPFGGTSGSPIVNREGQIVGIEKGFIKIEGTENLYENYVGATITPISYLSKVTEMVTRPI